MIYHFQGRSYLYNKEFMRFLRYKTSELPADVTVITCNSKSNGLLIPQLNASKIPYINVVPQGIVWDNRLKIKYILEALNYVTTKYVLILDAVDVVLDEFNSDIVNTFLTFGKKLVFNASKNNHPHVEVDVIENRDALGPFKYLNAGCCIGETGYAKYFYNKCYELKDIPNPCKSEQLIVRHVFANEQNNVGIDNECKLFQTVGHCTALLENDKWILK